MNIAIVGGGIFGISAALALAPNHAVDLFEKYDDILKAASGINQYRLHRGYHYPRSDETVESLLKAEASFRKEYGAAMIDGDTDHYYAISDHDSLTSADDYLEFCNTHGLQYEKAMPDFLNPDSVDLCIQVNEGLIDPKLLYDICWQKLKRAKITVHLSTEATIPQLEKYDRVVNCTYALQNVLVDPSHQRNYQYELCEKPVVQLPASFANNSLVVMDGPFMCFDPFGRTGHFVMGNVVHAIHQRSIGKMPIIPKKFQPLLNRGVIQNPKPTNFHLFIETASEFIPEIKKAKHIGSMYTLRTVLPNLESTDARPTIVERIDDRFFSIFSGKIGNCVDAARQAAKLIED